MSHFYTSWKRDIDMWHWCKWVKAYTIELFANIISSADLKLLTKFAKVLLQTLIWVQKVLLHMNAMQLLKSIEVISLTIDNDDIILIDYLHWKFGSVNFLKIRRPLKQLSKLSVARRSQKYLLGNFSANHHQIIWQISRVLHARLGVEVKLRVRKIERDGIKLTQAYHTTNI